MNNIKIVFMGTPDFAVPSLKALIDNGCNIVGVFSQPDRPQGRGYKLVAPEVKQLALEHNLPVFQPENFKDGEALAVLGALKPDLIVVVAYGQILPKTVLALPTLGCINVHGSLLPALRGAAPIQWSVINGDKTTGVTTMFMDIGLDTGDMILTESTEIAEDETAGELFDRLSLMGAELLLETIPLLVAGTAPRTKQDEVAATYAPIIKKCMGHIDFSKSAQQVHDLVRGMFPWPKAYCFLDKTRMSIVKTKVVESESVNKDYGAIVDDKNLVIACGTGSIQFLEVQAQGKRAVFCTDFCNGYRIALGKKFNGST